MFRVLIVVLALAAVCGAHARQLDRIEQPPAGWRGPVFAPRFDFPKKAVRETRSWTSISFRSEPERYLRAVLDYALDGQDRVHWRLQANRKRGWYHVPWLGPGPHGREFIHGLTRARDFAPGELGPAQTACRQNWAVAFYNEVGAATLGQIWGRGDRDPDLSALPFHDETVAVKVVFTEATTGDDPKLTGAPELQANIPASCSDTAREPRTLRLIQIDLAVRENRASYKTGWVFGSYRYDGTQPGTNPWAKLTPLGLMWGNDPALSDEAAAAGATPRQSIVFEAGKGFGRAGRMNGIVDDRSSACSSCHMAAQWPTLAPMTAPRAWSEARCWFRNLDARYTFGYPPGKGGGCSDPTALEKMTALDFSLQLTIALRNWSLERARNGDPTPTRIGKLRRTGEALTVNGLESIDVKR
jgi:hypothetical protein